MFGEAGREAFVPLDDKAAGMEILRQILPEFAPMKFATGGIIGNIMSRGSPGSSRPPVNLTFNHYGDISSDVHLQEVLADFKAKLIDEMVNDELYP